MGQYDAEWYGFEIDSKMHLMDLFIEPSFKPAVCLQFHIMQDDSYRVFYNFEPRIETLLKALKSYYIENNLDMSERWNVAMEKASKAKVFRPLAPVSSFFPDNEECCLIDELYMNELPAVEDKSCGLDGHSYKVLIYKDGGVNCFETWCVTPRSWGVLRSLVKAVVQRLNLDPGSYDAYVGRK